MQGMGCSVERYKGSSLLLALQYGPGVSAHGGDSRGGHRSAYSPAASGPLCALRHKLSTEEICGLSGWITHRDRAWRLPALGAGLCVHVALERVSPERPRASRIDTKVVDYGGGPATAMLALASMSISKGTIRDETGDAAILGTWSYRCAYLGGKGTGARNSHFWHLRSTLCVVEARSLHRGGIGYASLTPRWRQSPAPPAPQGILRHRVPEELRASLRPAWTFDLIR